MIDRVGELLAPYRRVMLIVAAGLLFVWIAFLDSHSLAKRVALHREAESFREQNQALVQEIERLEAELERDLTDEQVERIAREEYGMQRPDETVHPVIGGE